MRATGAVAVALGLLGCWGSGNLERVTEGDQEIPYVPPAELITYAPFQDLLAPPPEEQASALREGDLIEITVHGHPDLTHRARLTRDGLVTLPYVGDLRVGGLTLADAREKIRGTYEADFLVSAPTSILVVERAPRRVFVLGAVLRPGAFDIPIESDMSLLRAIAHAGGLQEEAERDGILLLRGERPGRTRLYRLSYTAVATEGQVQGDVRLLPGDTLLVPDRGKVTVLGAVNDAGVFPIPREGMTLTRAIALARGTTRFASPNNTVVTRPQPGGPPRSYQVALGEILSGRFQNNPVLHAGDVVFVPESLF
jgi:polysaccharide export outer membrane protein